MEKAFNNFLQNAGERIFVIKSIIPKLKFQLSEFKKNNDLTFSLLEERFIEYQKSVKSKQKHFDFFVFESLNEFYSVVYTSDINSTKLKKTIRIYGLLYSLFNQRPDLISKYFENDTFTFENYESLIEEFQKNPNKLICINEQILQDDFESKDCNVQKDQEIENIFEFNNLKFEKANEGIIEKWKAEYESLNDSQKKELNICINRAKFYLKNNNTKNLSTRIGGYLFKTELFKVDSLEEKKHFWAFLIYPFKLGDCTYLSNPSYSRNSMSIDKDKVKLLYDFFCIEKCSSISSAIKIDLIENKIMTPQNS